jgi:hypothetical protein
MSPSQGDLVMCGLNRRANSVDIARLRLMFDDALLVPASTTDRQGLT